MDSTRPRLRVDCFITLTTPAKLEATPRASLQPAQTCIRLLRCSRFLSLRHQELMRRKSCVRGGGRELGRSSVVPSVFPVPRKHTLRLPNAVLNLNFEAELGLRSTLPSPSSHRCISSAVIRGRAKTTDIMRTESRSKHGLLHECKGRGTVLLSS